MKNYKIRRCFLFLSVLSVFLFGCASVNNKIIDSAANEKNTIKNVPSVYLTIFTNNSYKPLINELITDELSKIIISGDNLKLVNFHDAEYIIRGVVLDYANTVESYDYNDRAQMYRLYISAQVKIVPQINTDFDTAAITFIEDASTIYSGIVAAAETERQAIERLKKIIAVKLYSTIIARINGGKN